jgi:hypothetical protein
MYKIIVLACKMIKKKLLCRVRRKKRGKVGKLPTSVAELVRKGVPEVYQKTAGKEPFLR